MAAITYAIQTVAEAGDNIVSVAKLYGGTYNLLAPPCHASASRRASPPTTTSPPWKR